MKQQHPIDKKWLLTWSELSALHSRPEMQHQQNRFDEGRWPFYLIMAMVTQPYMTEYKMLILVLTDTHKWDLYWI